MLEDNKRLREHGPYWVTRHSNGKYYICWYDAKSQQSRRRSLSTDAKSEAFAKFDRLAATSIGGDPDAARDAPVITTVADLMNWHAAERGPKLAAKAQMTASVTHVVAHFGRRGASCLGPAAVTEFVAQILAKGLTLGYAARIAAVLRAAVRAAHKRKLISEAYDIPNPQSKAERDAVPRKGRPMSAEEIAKLIDAMPTRHMVAYMRLALATAARRGAILEFRSEMYADPLALISLNEPGRVQTPKYRPIVIAIEAIRPWLRSLPPGPVVTSDARPECASSRSRRRGGLHGAAAASRRTSPPTA